ncbi:bifunctional phosphoribosyl-AMP cyclohydrolase/phosphoribosyl-ATP diphosphatase HisIE [Candidatus Puniceispirillum marinum]|uniref:Histidine biosynthesis bifunctional protein HisIE n=1 Tax=Puniceispirillum marinum (strain IMCC1322) TaxID=488538 RepID=D5BQW7_PUNMI|nr:bifunctional phosphoribosyl-AMP cyclohydrolase/phosphoribosyl-ATP diphosphatase HisIE [Candidatus Puniceispirillum marinum]ADE38681.1 phosphoribosyl-AMP cyclohydrolase HisIE [Candidatus Puniceispirillum marinum IMCC1322]
MSDAVMINLDAPDWNKDGESGLLPAIIQHVDTREVLMLGYMNRDALAASYDSGKVTFYSRSKQRLWMKGESSGNILTLIEVKLDCDNDSLLVLASPAGPTCHTGAHSCFGEKTASNTTFLDRLGIVIKQRHAAMPAGSYTTSLFEAGKARIAQKVGEEGVELALARMKDDKAEMANESADLLFHMMVLLEDADLSLADAISVLQDRHK